MGESIPGTCRQRSIRGYADDRLDACQSAPFGGGRKRGEQKQAIGRSRGGRNTKIHALADAKGRLLAILLTGGEAHDCPPAERLIRRVKRRSTATPWRKEFQLLIFHFAGAHLSLAETDA